MISIGTSAAHHMTDAVGQLAASLRKSTVQVRASRSGGGSGVVWRSDGIIVTNAHVATGKRVAVELHDGTVLRAEVTARDSERDLASLKVNASGLPAAPAGDSDAARAGDLAFAVGNPLGLVGAVTSGIIFAAGSQHGRSARWLQADIRIAPGNSGGPLADARGHVLGINSMMYGGLAIAVPSNAIQRFLRTQNGRPRLGVTVEPVSLRARTGAIPGLLIFEVASGSSAERAGLLPGDVIVRIGERPLRSAQDLPDTLVDLGTGGSLHLGLVRAGAPLELAVPLDAASSETYAA